MYFNRLVTAILCLVFAVVTTQAVADQEPTLNEVYAAAQAGKLEQAQVMMQQVLVTHPNSAKAHYVRAELFARQGKISQARASLAEAEKLAPGLPFAKPDAVRSLRQQLTAEPAIAHPAMAGYAVTGAVPPVATSSWVLPLLLTLGVIVVGYLAFRRRTPTPQSYPTENSSFQPAYSGGYAPPTYGQTASTGLGGQIMGGVATGLAVGAGVVAAEAIGRHLMGDDDTHPQRIDALPAQTYAPVVDTNADMGGQDFGINDAGSWDDGGAFSDAGGWDN